MIPIFVSISIGTDSSRDSAGILVAHRDTEPLIPGSEQSSSVCQYGRVGMGLFLPSIFTWGLIWTSEYGRSCI